MKLRKFLTGLIGLILVTIIAASSTVFAEEVSETEFAELKLSDSDIYEDYHTQSMKRSEFIYMFSVKIGNKSGFKCIEGEESTTSLIAQVRFNTVTYDYLPSDLIEWSTPNSDLISIKNPHSLETTIVGLKSGKATVTFTFKIDSNQTKSDSFTFDVAPKSGNGITNPGPTGPSTPPSSYNSNYEETTEVYRLYLAANNEHLYTKDKSEVENLEANGWTVDNNGQPLFNSGGSKPIYRLYHEGTKRHHLTADKAEYDALSNNGWSSEGTALNAAN